jgi:hypothetical protein|tara:strand:- start:259 stop:513 length:255 start_codon:yes stop_codon:yes gene_type:complete
MNNKFLDKVIEQILSETRVIDDKVYTDFFLLPYPFPFSILSGYLPSSFYIHCKEVYSLNKEETEYIWVKYKEGLTALINDKELV